MSDLCISFLQEDEYEWFKAFAEFRHLLLPHLKPGDKILILGCGNSLLPMDLWREGFRDITSVDLSPAVIHKMAARAEAAVRPLGNEGILSYTADFSSFGVAVHLRLPLLRQNNIL